MPAASRSPLPTSRRAFPAIVADLAFSMLVPDGFVEPELPERTLNVEDPTSSMPLALVSSPVAGALVVVAARPAFDDGCVEQWMRFLCVQVGIELSDVREGVIGREEGAAACGHRAMLATGAQVQDGTPLVFQIAMFEDGGRLLTVQAMAPCELWPTFGEALSAAVASVRLDRPKGQAAAVAFKELVEHHAQA